MPAVWGKQTQTYPTAATTRIRLDTYDDVFSTIYNSTYTIHDSTWNVFVSTWMWLDPGQKVTGYYEAWQGTTPVVLHSTWTLNAYNDLLIQQMQNEYINEIDDQDVEEYMVWPGTVAPAGWQGWCLSIINGKNVPIACPH